MKFKKATLVMLILLVFLTIGAVSASTDTDDLATPDVNGDTISTPDDTGASDNSQTILKETEKTTTGDDDSEQEAEEGYDVTTDTVEKWDENRETNFINISTPKDADKTNRIIVTKEVEEGDEPPVLFNNSLDDRFWSNDNKTETEDKTIYLLSISDLSYFDDHLYEGFLPLKFRVTDSTEETELLSKTINFYDEDGNFIAREEEKEDDGIIDRPDFYGPNEEEGENEFDKTDSAAQIGYLYIPAEMMEKVTITFTKNDTESLYLPTGTEITFDENKNAYKYPITLDLTKFKDKDCISLQAYYLDIDDWGWNYAIQIDGNKAIFYEYDGDALGEFYVFFGNLTRGEPNNMGMGPEAHGNFIRLSLPEDILTGELIIEDEDGMRKELSLSDFKKGEYDYGILGYEYTIDIDSTKVPQLTENKEVTFILTLASLTNGNQTIIKKRIQIGDYLYIIPTLYEVTDMFWTEITDKTLTNENDTVATIRNDGNPQAIRIDLGNGHFSIYVDGNKVENLGKFGLKDGLKDLYLSSFWPENWGEEPLIELNMTLAQLGIVTEGNHNIKITYNTTGRYEPYIVESIINVTENPITTDSTDENYDKPFVTITLPSNIQQNDEIRIEYDENTIFRTEIGSEDSTWRMNAAGNYVCSISIDKLSNLDELSTDHELYIWAYGYERNFNLIKTGNTIQLIEDNIDYYFYPTEIELVNKNITFRTSTNPTPENGTNGSGQGQQGGESGQGTGTTSGQTTNPPAQTGTTPGQTTTGTTNTNTANQITITPAKTTTPVSKKAKKLTLTTKLKIGNKIAKRKTVTYIIKGKRYKATTNNKGIAKLKLNKKQLQRILRNTKPGQKIKYQLKYGKKTITKYIKIKK